MSASPSCSTSSRPATSRRRRCSRTAAPRAVENAVKLARKFTGRPAIICFEGGYHGRTLLTLSLTSKYGLFKSGFGPFAPEIVRLPMPKLYRTPAGMTEEQYLDFAHPPARACAGRAGRSVGGRGDDHRAGTGRGRLHPGAAALPPAHPRAVRRARDRDDRRRGAVRLRPHRPRVRDASTTASCPISSSPRSRSARGMPIGAVTGRAEIMDAAHLGGVGGTYGGSPVACAAAHRSGRP